MTSIVKKITDAAAYGDTYYAEGFNVRMVVDGIGIAVGAHHLKSDLHVVHTVPWAVVDSEQGPYLQLVIEQAVQAIETKIADLARKNPPPETDRRAR